MSIKHRELLVPIPICLRNFLKDALHILVCCFHCTIGMRTVWKGPMMFDLELVTVFFNLLGYEVCPIPLSEMISWGTPKRRMM